LQQPLTDKPGVLVVDDEHYMRTLVEMGLQRAGFNVMIAANGREAIQVYEEQHAHIAMVLLDVRMPDPDGPTTLDRLRALNPDVHVCFMSGDTGDYDPEELIHRGAMAVIAKPFRLDRLADALYRLIQDAAALAPAAGTEIAE
jgi:DNA-binding NtrC family response regulator